MVLLESSFFISRVYLCKSPGVFDTLEMPASLGETTGNKQVA